MCVLKILFSDETGNALSIQTSYNKLTTSESFVVLLPILLTYHVSSHGYNLNSRLSLILLRLEQPRQKINI